jgi:chitinase
MNTNESKPSLGAVAATVTVTMNDDTNTLLGLNNSMMISRDGGHFWEAYNEYYRNYFPGSPLVMVAKLQELALNSEDYDLNKTYSGGDVVRDQGYYWTAQWWVDQGISPGSDSVWLKGDAISYERYGTFQFSPFTGDKATQIQTKGKQDAAKQRKVIGYFPEWGVYEAHDYFTPDKIDFSKLTHLNYGFAVVEEGQVIIHDTVKGPGLLRQLAKMTKAHGVTSMVSVGGWTNSAEGVFEAATATAAGIETLAESMVAFVRRWDFDGLDVDWEYPDNNTEKANFTTLIQKLRSKLDAAGLLDDKYYQLSAAVTTNHNNIQFINPAVTAPLLDSVNVMAYDIHGAFDAITGHNAPLFANSEDADQLLNVSSAMQAYCVTWGVPKYKLMMGVPFYGRGWGNVAATQVVKGLPGLFCAGSATVHGAWDDEGDYTGTNPFYVLKQKLASADYTRYWDDESKVPYLYNAKTKEFLTYDDAESIQTKVNYINDQGFGGAIIWDISGDTGDFELGTIVGTLKNSPITNFDTPQIHFFTGNNYAGAKISVSDNIPDFKDVYTDDGHSADNTISSSKDDVGSLGYFIFTDNYYNFGMENSSATRVTGDLAKFGNLYNDKCSSFKIIKMIGYAGEDAAKGEVVTFLEDCPDLTESRGYNISSIKLLPGYCVRLYEGIHYTGAYRDVMGSPFPVNLSSFGFDKRVYSARFINLKVAPKATFFDGSNYSGNTFDLYSDVPTLTGVVNSGGVSANDMISSATHAKDCLGYEVYTGDNFTGSSTVVKNDLTTYNSTFNNNASSIREVKAFLYSGTGFSGNEHAVSINNVVLEDTGVTNIKSIKVAKGYAARIYDQTWHTGNSIVITDTDSCLDLATLGFANKVLSIMFIKL